MEDVIVYMWQEDGTMVAIRVKVYKTDFSFYCNLDHDLSDTTQPQRTATMKNQGYILIL